VPDRVAQNRTEVVSVCIDAGMNYLDLTGLAECMAYGAALKGRREKMIVGADDYKLCVRRDEHCNVKSQLRNVEECLRCIGTDYLDIWRPQAKMDGTNTDDDVKVLVETFHKLHDAGKAKHLGVSSHSRRWLQYVIEKFPEFELVIFPCTAKTKETGQALTKDNVMEGGPAVRNSDLVQSIFQAARQRDIGVITIKPFMGGSLFGGRETRAIAAKGDRSEEENDLARLTLQCILGLSDAITAVIPGQSTVSEAKNAALASSTRQLGHSAAATEWLRRVTDQQWADLPQEYAWLRDWEFV
jgi:predicted aldo/keto reductase-like oxidoreductase